MALYQDIMNVPGLSGNSYARQKQLYEQLGSPMGSYRGTYDQNIWLLGQIAKGNYGTQTSNSTTSTSGGSASLINELKGDAPSANQPFFPSLTEQWDLIQPAAMNAAAQAVDPELQRQYDANYRTLMQNMASTGAGSFGRGLGQVGALQAETQRNRTAQLYDVANQYRQGFEDLYYNPTWEAWKNSLTNAKPGEVPTAPSWDEFYSKYGGKLGPNIQPNTGYKAGLNFGSLPGVEMPRGYGREVYFPSMPGLAPSP